MICYTVYFIITILPLFTIITTLGPEVKKYLNRKRILSKKSKHVERSCFVLWVKTNQAKCEEKW